MEKALGQICLSGCHLALQFGYFSIVNVPVRIIYVPGELMKYLGSEDDLSEQAAVFKLAHYPTELPPGMEPRYHACKQSHCDVSIGQSNLAAADVVMVSLSEVKNFTKLVELRQGRRDQYWVHLSARPPPINGADRDDEALANYKMVDHLFNFTMSYRYDHSFYFFDRESYLLDSLLLTKREIDFRSDSDIPIHPFIFSKAEGKRDTDLLKELELRERTVAWMPNRCDQNSDSYVNRLRLSLNVDVIGVCGSNYIWCSGETLTNISSECANWVRMNYMFMLVVDDAFCTKFISPEIFKVLEMNLIPIVVSAYNKIDVFPQGSVIHAGGESADSLVELIKTFQVLTHHAIYERFFSWRQKFDIWKPNTICGLCDRIKTFRLDNQHARKRHRDWMKEEFRCFPDWHSFLSSYQMSYQQPLY